MPTAPAATALSSPYPATDPGFPALPVAELLASTDDLIARIRLCFGLSRDSFETDVQPLLKRYAAYVHLLPATPDNYFSAPGGLLRLGLEVAFFSLQGTDAHIFSGRSTISVRRQLEPRWRQATFIGGLCCELHRVLSHLIVTDASGAEWPAFMLPLADWLASRNADRYFVRWRPNAVESRGLGIFALPLVVPASSMQFLADHNSVIVPHLLASVGGMPVYRDHNVLDGLVRRSLALVVDRNLQAHADRYGAPQFGSHLERYLVDAMRRLNTSAPNWTPNRDKSRTWLGPDGLFLLWPQAAADMQALLEADQLAGIPKSPETVLEMLLAAGVFERRDDASATWLILPPESKAAMEAVKLSSSAILFAGLETQPQPLARPLICQPGAERPAPRQPPSRPAPSASTQFSLLDSPTPAPLTTSAPAPTEAGPSQHVVPPTAPTQTLIQPPPPSQPANPALSAFKLNAPMRLNPAVRDALSAIVDTLNGPGSGAAAAAVANGLFVPLHELERRGIQPALAVRALADVGLLVHTDHQRPATVSHPFAGEPTVGLVLMHQCVSGFDPEAFAPPTPRPPSEP